MTRIFSDPIFERHLTGQHPESQARLAHMRAHQKLAPWLAKAQGVGAIQPATRDQLMRAHAPSVLAKVEAVARKGGGSLDADTVMGAESLEVALKAAGTAIAAVDNVLGTAEATALCLVRPPGHHATREESMGFCLFNNVAIAAKHALEQHQLSRILIVDWDVHHGNGTQDIFYDSDAVFFLSMHRFPFYPGTGAATETGTGRGLGHTMNLPIDYGLGREAIIDTFRRGLAAAAERLKPELVIISAGFDAHKDDPIGSLGLEAEDFRTLTKATLEVAAVHAGGRVVSCLEGGYNLEALADSVLCHIEALSS